LSATTLLAVAGVCVMSFAMCAAMVSDLLTFRIPNILPVLVTVAFIPTALAVGVSGMDVLAHVSAAAALLLICFILFVRGYIGGGDAKLLSAGALWTGWTSLYAYVFFVAAIGGVFAVILIVFRRFPLPEVASRVGWLAQLHGNRDAIPYGVAIGGGMLVSLWRMPLTVPILGQLGLQ
jgi:prepilin peptidase CpaA